MRIRNLDSEEQVENPRQYRIPDPPVEPRHRALVDGSLEPRSDHHVPAGAQLVDERFQVDNRIRPVAVRHDDVLAACCTETREVCTSVTASALEDHPRAP